MVSMKSTFLNEETALYKKLKTAILIISASMCVLFAFVLCPLIAFVNSDGTISYWPDILEWLLDSMHLATFFSCFGITLYCMYRFAFYRVRSLIIIFSSFTVGKYALNLLSDFFIFTGIPKTDAKAYIIKSVQSVAIQAALELVQFGIVLLIGYSLFKKHKELCERSKESAKKINKEYDERSLIFPFKKLVSLKNVLQRSAFMATLVICLFRVLPRIFYDIFYSLFYQSTNVSSDAIVIIIYYTLDIALSVIGYLFMIFIFNKLDTADLKARVKYANKQ